MLAPAMLALPVALPAGTASSTDGTGAVDVELFVRTGCSRCEAAAAFLETLRHAEPTLTTRMSDVSDPEARRRLESLVAATGTRAAGVPAFAVRGILLIGFSDAEQMRRRIQALLEQPGSVAPGETPLSACRIEQSEPCEPVPPADEIVVPLLGVIRVSQVGLPMFTVAIGLVDGFNPCSMWVLLLMVSLLVACATASNCCSSPARSSWWKASRIWRSWRRG
jgi:hypothetical protein